MDISENAAEFGMTTVGFGVKCCEFESSLCRLGAV